MLIARIQVLCFYYSFLNRRFNKQVMSSGKHLKTGDQKPVFPDDGMLILYSMRFCPYAHRVHLVLDAKNIPYHTVFINLTEKPEWLAEISPAAKVPALTLVQESDKPTLVESLIIAEYLDEKYPENTLYPDDPLQKAKDKMLMERFSVVTTNMYKLWIQGTEGAPGALTEVLNGLDIYEKELGIRKTEFFGGSKPGILDYMIWPWCERADMLEVLIGDKYELDETRFAKLAKWRTLMIADPAVKCSYLDGPTHAKFMISRREGEAEYDMLVNNKKRQKTY